MKKAIIAGTSIATMALMVMPALAKPPIGPPGGCCFPKKDSCCPEVNVDNETISKVKTINVTVANSGLNGVTQFGGFANNAGIKTNEAIASSEIGVVTGSTKAIVEAPQKGKVEVDNLTVSKVKTINITAANSGLNKVNQGAGFANNAGIDAGSATAISSIGVVTGDTVTVVH